MKLTREDIKKIAGLARLEFAESELDRFAEQLSHILGHMEQLNRLETDDIAPTAYTLRAGTPLRADEVKSSDASSAVLEQSPDHEGTLFRVPKVI